ncbi:MAG TPA: DUF2062 domain-containing protein [bacterium]|nr:DUF2062 domain-containing protein [bacterium]
MSFKGYFRYFYLKILRIDDSPHRIALGVALGAFCGVFPGVGPVFSLVLAFVFRANKAAAVLGALSVNTWISVMLVAPAVKIGGLIFGVRWRDLTEGLNALREDFTWRDLFSETGRKVLVPALTGFLICSLIVGAAAYAAAYLIIADYRRIKERRARKYRQAGGGGDGRS